MSYCCSQCSFTAQFESALTMHHQLYHEPQINTGFTTASNENSNTLPRTSDKSFYGLREKGLKLAGRTASATQLFGKLRARICRSKTLFAHPEESNDDYNDLRAHSDCTSKAMRDLAPSIVGVNDSMKESHKEIFSCHLCSFDTDRITILDRHLLNDHKICLENLLKLVMAKTKYGLSEDGPTQLYGIRQPYYRSPDGVVEDGEFVIETVTPKIKILKHAGVNTDLKFTDIPDLNDNCNIISREIEKLIDVPIDKCDRDTLFAKMQSLNEYMCKFVNSSNTLKHVLNKEFVQKKNSDRNNTESFYNLGLGESGKMKFSSDSFYF